MNSSKPAGLAFLMVVVLSVQSLCRTVKPTLKICVRFSSGVSGAIVGICYGRNGDNLPSPADTVALYKRIKVDAIRMYEPFADMFEALRGSGLMVAFGPRNEELQAMAQDPSTAQKFVNTWIVPYKNDIVFKWITLGNEIIPGDIGPFVPGAMRNVNAALQKAGVSGIAVTTVLAATALTNSYPPSASQFVPDVTEIMTEIASILSQTNSPLMVNIYPYFAYASDPEDISLDYATFGPNATELVDGYLRYHNLFESMVDGFNAALEKIGSGGVRVVVAESGWPTRGNAPYTSVENARKYHVGLLSYVVQAKTPRRPETDVDTFFFEMFTEDLKQGEVEQSFGLFNPDMNPVYEFWSPAV
ncbi:PREDICTED: putative glucan endo-1,3-beta-glucosidase GVI [Tarenaya hassleriana]|uniref:putative glucan endo-1,3-beta-glucosidase GVI n=1 Tax=Tarenaya hassleriana TaxID=28532 RepID=UPI00053C655A|nr:PREDICTED: putative glucan endo-1,3-beta-glucosidase GVI [Tarenaya hassleriana]